MDFVDFYKMCCEIAKHRLDQTTNMTEEERHFRKAGIDFAKEIVKELYSTKKSIVEVVAALIWDKDKFLICQRPAHKSRGMMWEFVGGKVEQGETKEQALIRECNEELAITVELHDIFMEATYEYPDIIVHLTLFNCAILRGKPQLLEHNDMKWITTAEIPSYDFCPADKEILQRICFGQSL